MKRTQDRISKDGSTSWPGGDGAASGSGDQSMTPSAASGSASPAPTMSSGSPAMQPTTLPDGGLIANAAQSPVPASIVFSSTTPNKEPTSNPKLVVRAAGEPDRSELSGSWYGPMPARGDAHEQYCLGLKYEAGIGVAQSFKQAKVWYRMAAEQGHPIAQLNLGVMHEYGRGAMVDFTQAAEWYRKAAEQGNACAQTNLAYLYRKGAGVHRDFKLMEIWYRKAANQGYARAQTALGEMYESGNGVEKDATQAVEWYRKAAEQGYVLAQTNLGDMYCRGVYFGQSNGGFWNVIGVHIASPYEHAMEWYRKAAEQGYARAQTELGWLYEKGRGVFQNFELAVEWYRKAADHGYAPAQTNLGLMYEDGKGVAQDLSQALSWYNMAADTGYGRAKNCLGRMYASGIGVEKDVLKAAHYLLQDGLKVEAGQKEITFFISGYEEVMACITEFLKNNKYKEFEGVTKFKFKFFRLTPDVISAITRFIRSNTGIRSISIRGIDLQYTESVGFARHMADVIQEANTELTELYLEYMHGHLYMYGHLKQDRLDQVLGQNKAINDLREDLRKRPPVKSDELPLEVLIKVIDELIVNSIRGGQTKEATQAAVDEFLISAQFGVMTSQAKPLANQREPLKL